MFIPLWQPLSPALLLKGNRRTTESSFPLNHPHSSFFYYARIGIYHLGRRLAELGMKRVLFPAYHHGIEVKALRAAGLELDYFNVLESGDIDLEDLEAGLKRGAQVLFVTHYNGFAQPMSAIERLQAEYGPVLIEDAALSLFAKSGGRYVGQFGAVGIFCPYKTFPIPDGGLLIFNDPELDPKVTVRYPGRMSTWSHLARRQLNWLDQKTNGAGQFILRLRPLVKGALRRVKAEPVPIGDSRFDLSISDWGMSRASGFFMNRCEIGPIVESRRSNYLYLANRIKEEALPVQLMYPELPEGAVPLFFPLRVRDRDRIHFELARCGVETSCFWKPWLPEVPAQRFPGVSTLRNEVLELPIHQSLGQRHLDYLFDKLKLCLTSR